MSTIDMAERMSRARAISFYVFAAVSVLLLMLSMSNPASDFLGGMWMGLTFAASLGLLPIKRWLRPRSAVARLMDDDGVREHRRMACTAGFWATVASAFVVAMLVADASAPLSAFNAVRVVAGAGIVAALICFATLELRAGR